MELFGARLGRRFVDLLDKGSKGISDLGKAFAALKFTGLEIDIGDKFAKQFGILDLVVTRARQKLALLFGEGLTDLIGAFTETLLGNFERVHSGLRNVVEQGVKPIIEDLIRLLRGEPVQTEWVADLGTKFQKLGGIIEGAVGIIGAAFQALRSAAAGVAGAVNSIFGTKVSGDALLLAAAVLKVTGVLSLFVTGLGLAGAASLLFLRTITLVAAGVRLLLGAIGAFAVLTNPFATLIAGIALLAGAFLLAGTEARAAMKSMFASLLGIASEGIVALGALFTARLREVFNVKPDESLAVAAIAGFFKALFNAAADFGGELLRLGNFLGAKLAEGVTSSLSSIPVIGGLFVGLPEQFAQIASEIVKQSEKLGGDVGKTIGDNASATFAQRFAPFETFLDKIQRKLEEAGFKFDLGGDAGKALDAVVGKGSSAEDVLKRMGITADSAKAKLGQLGQAGSQAFQSISKFAEEAGQKITDINAKAASQAADLRDEARKLAQEKQNQLEAGKDTSAIDAQLATAHRKMREQEEDRRRQIDAIARAEQQNIAALKAQNAELALQQRLRDSAAAAALSRPAPTAITPPVPGQLPGQLAGQQPIDTTAINAALVQLGTAVQGATQSLQGLQGLDFTSVATAVQTLNDVLGPIGQSLQGLDFSGLAQSFQDITTAVQQAGSELQGLGLPEAATALQAVTEAANSAAQALRSIEQSGAGSPFASGGMVRGPGTSTSDSILARLSRGEFVVRAAAVKHYGTNLLSALNGLRIPRPTGFNLGGLVEGMQHSMSALMVPRFAEGGFADMQPLAVGRRPIALTINNGGEQQTFPVWADEDVAEKVVRYTISRKVASAGRKSGAFA
jgi:hypothetical protein